MQLQPVGGARHARLHRGRRGRRERRMRACAREQGGQALQSLVVGHRVEVARQLAAPVGVLVDGAGQVGLLDARRARPPAAAPARPTALPRGRAATLPAAGVGVLRSACRSAVDRPRRSTWQQRRDPRAPRADARAGGSRPRSRRHCDVASLPPPGQRRQVVRRDGDERVARVVLRRLEAAFARRARSRAAGTTARRARPGAARISSGTVPRSSPITRQCSRWLSRATMASSSSAA